MIDCAGAAAITGKPLARIEVHGKQLFYFFGEDPATQVLQSRVDDGTLGQIVHPQWTAEPKGMHGT